MPLGVQVFCGSQCLVPTAYPRTWRPNTAGQVKVGLGRWICYKKNSCEWTVHTYFLNQSAPDEGSVKVFLLTSNDWLVARDPLELWGAPRHTHKESIAESLFANSKAYMRNCRKSSARRPSEGREERVDDHARIFFIMKISEDQEKLFYVCYPQP